MNAAELSSSVLVAAASLCAGCAGFGCSSSEPEVPACDPVPVIAPKPAIAPIAAPKPTVAPYMLPCDPVLIGPDLAIGTRTDIDRHHIYKLAGTPIELCIVSSGYPLSIKGHHHFLSVLIEVHAGSDVARYNLTSSTYLQFHGVQVAVGMAKPSFESPGVWVYATRATAIPW